MKIAIAILVTIVFNLLLYFFLDSFIDDFRFYSPYALVLLVLIPIIIIYRDRFFFKSMSRMVFSSLDHAKKIKPSLKIRFRPALFILKLLFLSLLVYALARPQAGLKERKVETEGVDIVLAVDVSTSMQAEDFKPNRLGAVKNVLKDFISKRVNDRIGLTIFAGQSFTQCPLTLDYGVLISLIDKLNFADRDWDGTAIGNGLANAVNRIKESQAKSKVIILLTDGKNNQGEVDPLLAAELAKVYKIKVYTIGAGTNGIAMIPVDDPLFGTHYRQMQVQIDEELLNQIAENTSGKYFRATNKEELATIYEDIDKLEKTKINITEFTRYSELFHYFMLAGVICFLLDFILGNTWLEKLP
ncbi:MAG: VWA domain-containing protein [Calditrichaeota bacterium]|nr:VWA domain-containing protein [Calditrichota bacterium]